MGKLSMELYLKNLSKRYKKAKKSEKGLILQEKWTPKMRQWCRIETIVVGVKKWLRKSSVQSLKQKLQSKH